MPTWTAAGNGTWTDVANWSGGVPLLPGSIANFNFALNGGGNVIIGILETSDVHIGSMNINMTGSTGLFIRGSVSDTGTGVGDLIFDNGASTAQLNITTLATTNPTTFSSAAGLRMTLASDLNANIVTLGSTTVFDIPVLGTGKLIKSGQGTLELNGSNTFTGGIDVTAGILLAANDAALGTGLVTISNSATFSAGGGFVNNTIATVLDALGSAGSAQIVAAPATSLALTGTLSHLSQGTINFGSITDTGTVVASFLSIQDNPTNSSYRIAGGTLRIGNTISAANLFDHPGTGLTELTNGAILDTNGFATTISNLDFDAGTIRSSTGTLNVTVNDVFVAINSQTGTIEGTAGVDQFTVNAEFGFNLSAATLLNWTAGTDLITFNGSANANSLTGSTGRDTINGFDGNDTLNSGGGVDTINGGNGDDTITIISSGSFLDGGADIDTLSVSGSASVGSVTGFEAINLGTGALLALTNTQMSTGFIPTSTLSGNGTIQINFGVVAGAQSLLIKGMSVAVGSTVALDVNGSTGVEIIKLPVGASANINTGGGLNTVQAGDLADVIIGGSGIDKLAGNGGADTMTGGGGADVFKFRKASDSGLGANADVITDFLHGTDKLNFVRIDTDPFTAGDQGFVFVDTVSFTNNGVAQIRWVDLGADLRVEADINGDGVADMHILLQGAGAQVLGALDFLL